MSSSGPAKLLVLAALVTGCMKIYPDTELPDIEVTWGFGCEPGVGDVHVVVVDYLDEVVAAEASAPCVDGKVTFPDVARRRYVVGGVLLALDGTPYAGSYTNDVDLRAGFGERVELFFGERANLRVAWRFEDGGRCASHDATTVLLEVTTPDFVGTRNAAHCRLPPLFTMLAEDVTSIRLLAIDDRGTSVAASPTVGVTVEPAPDAWLDLGTLVLQ